MGPWLNPKLEQFASQIGTNLLVIDNVGKYLTEELDPNQEDKGNYPWKLTNIDGLMDIFQQINNDSIWDS